MNTLDTLNQKGYINSDNTYNFSHAIILKAMVDFVSNDELFYAGEIVDLYHKDGVEITFGFNVVGAVCDFVGVVSVEFIDKYLPYYSDICFDELMEDLEDGELTEAEAKQFVLEAIADKVTFCQFVK